MKLFVSFVSVCALVVTLTGCKAIKTQVIEIDRVDQDVSGNRGYLAGRSSEPVRQPKPKTRQILEVDVSKYFED